MASNSFSRVGFVLTLAMGLAAIPAADASQKNIPPPNALWQEECGSCHLAYPPRFLSAPSWQRVMAGLDDHFKTDASLEPAVAQEITAWLVANARRPKPGKTEPAPPPLRITETRWFRAEHDEISAARFRGPAIGSAANCAACHTTADKGNFSERNIRIPPK
ncbi:MAG: diheme cytochrome c [Gammaproteobacteria bacterium]|nr:diheme cytochrome c [Gammaproteobacteria bacterium]